MEQDASRHWARVPLAKPYSHWNSDTEQAFLLALRLTGRAVKAAETIGRSVQSAYKRRRTNPAFAARWDAAVAEQQAEWVAAQGKTLQALAEAEPRDTEGRWNGWSEARRKMFLCVLAETGSVNDAAGRARISVTSAYNLRQSCARFAESWDNALDSAAVTLEQAAFERAVQGWEEPIVKGGEIVGYRRRYSDMLLRMLLVQARAQSAARPVRDKRKEQALLVANAHEAARMAGGNFSTPLDWEEAKASILRKLEAIERHDRRKAELEAARAAQLPAPGDAR